MTPWIVSPAVTEEAGASVANPDDMAQRTILVLDDIDDRQVADPAQVERCLPDVG